MRAACNLHLCSFWLHKYRDDTRGATCKLLKIIALGVFRVTKTITLKIAKRLLLCDLQVTLAEAVSGFSETENGRPGKGSPAWYMEWEIIS